MKKKIAVAVSLLLVLALSVGGTIAWLTDSDSVTNTFTIGKVDITLNETTGNSYKIMPGRVTAKNPVVTVVGNSENSYVFIKIEKLNGAVTYTPAGTETPVTTSFGDFISFSVNEEWKTATGLPDGVYYQEYTSQQDNKTYQVLGEKTTTDGTDGSKGAVEIPNSVTMEMITALKNSQKNPELKITAYAIQKEGTGTVTEAWAKLNP